MGVDINTPPSIPVFDKSKYRLPRQQLQYNTNNISEDETGMTFELFIYYMWIYLFFTLLSINNQLD